MIYEKKSILIAILSIISCIFNMGLNIYLIPIYGIYAAVIATLISYSLQALLFTFFANRKKIDKEFIQILLLSIVLFISILMQLKFYISSIFTGAIILYIYSGKKMKCIN
jgi:O-antigen/teichoic acid export membrane protein